MLTGENGIAVADNFNPIVERRVYLAHHEVLFCNQEPFDP